MISTCVTEKYTGNRCGLKLNRRHGFKVEASFVIGELVRKYCQDEGTFEDLVKWIYSCIAKSLYKNSYLKLKLTYTYEECTIKYLKDTMIFSITKVKDFDDGKTLSENIYEVGVWVSAYLLSNYGDPVAERLAKDLLFSETDLYDLSKEISEDVEGWCKNIENVFKLSV
jgi:hypothetical protein